MKCPACGWDGAYVGASIVECANPSCRHWDQRAAAAFAASLHAFVASHVRDRLAEAVKKAPVPMPGYNVIIDGL